MSNQSILQPVREAGWRRGFANLFRQENKKWWKTRRWWVQTLIWLLVTNGILAIILWGEGESFEEGIELFMIFMNVFVPIGVAVSMQGSIVGEKQSGTAAWVLSKPVSRPAFVLSRGLTSLLASTLIMIIIPGIAGYLQIMLATGVELAIRPFINGLALAALGMAFYLTMTLMLGTFFNSRGPVIGIPLAVLFGPSIAGDLLARYAPWILDILPTMFPQMAPMIAVGEPVPTWTPIIITSVWSILFVAVAVWRFGREEF